MTLRPTESGHVCDGTLMAFLDEELKAAQRAAVGRHVHACRACGERLARLRTASNQLSGALPALHDDPVLPADAVSLSLTPRALTGRQGRTGQAPRSRRRPVSPRRRWRAGVWAAALVVLSAGALAAFPGSPVHTWLSRKLGDLARGQSAAARGSPTPPAPVVSILPYEGSVTVRLTGTTSATHVHVRLVAGTEARVEAPGATFRAGPGFVDVSEGSESEHITIDLPRSVRSARVEIDGRLAVIKDGELLRRVGAATGTSDSSVELGGGVP